MVRRVFEGIHFDEAKLRARAREFDAEIFRERMKAFVDEEWAKFSSSREA